MLRKILILLLLTQACMAEKPWEKKPFDKWSIKEINQFLGESPWAKTVHVTNVNPRMLDESGVGSRRRSAAETASLSEESAPRISYRVQLRSATPVRRAIARKSRLDSNYEKLPPEQRTSLDASINRFLAQKFDDTIVVEVAFLSNAPTVLFEVRNYWTAQTVESLQDKLSLTIGETNIRPDWFEADGTSFQAHFKRPQGIDANARILVQFQSPTAGVLKEQKVVAHFNAPEMIYEGAISF